MNLCWSRNPNTLRSRGLGDFTGRKILQLTISNPRTIGGNPKAKRNGKSHPR
jgi:hypothetical protein